MRRCSAAPPCCPPPPHGGLSAVRSREHAHPWAPGTGGGGAARPDMLCRQATRGAQHSHTATRGPHSSVRDPDWATALPRPSRAPRDSRSPLVSSALIAGTFIHEGSQLRRRPHLHPV
ncbi:hypothetical protein NDU88_004162 [Pleurodeles waltl]|uniref:Uncharacterized protein n=1 Tax=Pleurodeles waltl TaxID=8319 RepID=A0AAV7RHB9_PLEWA|nr:hypothetical protein NDU88_004162 [Pleurodeles waltl]